MNRYLIAKIASIVIAVASQVLLKKSANKTYDSKIKEYLNFEVIFAYGLFVFSMLLNVYAMVEMSVSYSSVLESLSYILIPITGHLFFKEKINSKQFIGIIIIIVGMFVYNL